jgi:acetyl-CoA decarbonylase/synthase complex subunit gamma
MECCCKKKNAPWITGSVETPAGKIPKAGTRLTFWDEWGALKVRFAIGRMNYSINPGLYAIGSPTPESPVFVTANYKLSFDFLRGALTGVDSWVLILDTKGINVWCAAGKGTFGTAEIVNRVQQTKLDQVVSHRKLIVPQLGAPGVSAHEVQKQCGFKVIYGPVRAEDLPEFLTANFKTTPEMRRVRFTLRDRIAVIPVELIIWFKQALGLAVIAALLGGISHSGFSLADAPRAFGLVFAGWLTGGVLVPILLPWLPGRAFSIKGLWVGIALWLVLFNGSLRTARPTLEIMGWGLILIAIVSFMALNFTGTSTYTSMSGVKKEMKIAMPLQLLAVISGTFCIVLGNW